MNKGMLLDLTDESYFMKTVKIAMIHKIFFPTTFAEGKKISRE